MGLKWTKRGAFATPFFLIASIGLAGGGHGTLIPLKVLYPLYAFIHNTFEEFFAGQIIFWWFFLTQYVLYGALIDLSYSYKKGIIFRVFLIMIHLLMVLHIFLTEGYS